MMNDEWNFDLHEIISDIAMASDLSDSLEIYKNNISRLKGYKFVFANANLKGFATGISIDKDFPSGGVVRSLYGHEKVFVLDEVTFEEMAENKTAQFAIDYSISLDTQALSYLNPFIYTPKSNQLHDKIREVFDFISQEHVWVDSSPYDLENSFNLLDSKNHGKIFNKVRAYEFLRNLDVKKYNSTKEISCHLSDVELIKATQEHLAHKFHGLEDLRVVEGLKRRFNIVYVLLLIIAIVQLGHKRASLFEKMKLYFEYNDRFLAAISLREAILAREFFVKQQNLLFFSKVQINKKGIFSELRNMTWDVLHFKQLEESATFKLNKEARYFFPAILTFDQKFIEIIELFKLKSLVYNDKNNIFPFYLKNIDDFDGLSLDEKEFLKQNFFSKLAKISRAMRLEDAKNKLADSVGYLEAQLSEITEVPIDYLI
ncbi:MULTISPECIES: hypothetical protein [Acinetobacter]|uniref:hypothetical protein n=1 Tax=Acinetobacter TaxID=469 RepID=UPI0002D11B14|nr:MULTISPECIES: hypothetical protein [Acinetobacter]ENX61245.1 hypothetical protein F885_01645 [Acinetobacter higginsii]MCH7318853.1 hypothetical protein [Acinetobacter higginsii]